MPAWLLSINPEKVKQEVQDKLVEYQEHASEVLANAFLNKQEPQPEKTATEMLLESVQHLVNLEKKQKEIELGLKQTNNKLDVIAIEQQRLLTERDNNMKQLFEVERSQVLPLQKTCKALIKRLVEAYVKASGLNYGEVYSKLYNEFDDRYNTKIRVKAKNREVTTIDYIESIMMLEPLFAIASHVLVLKEV